MKTTYLLKYQCPKYFVLTEYIDYELQLEIIWCWGLFKTLKTTTYRIYDHQDANKIYKHWDELINNKLPIRVNN